MALLDDPELLATFVAEAEDRLGSLTSGLLALEPDLHTAGPGPGRTAVVQLFRDAHTLKGSARMLGLAGVEQLAHGSEDLLAALRDGRMAVSPDIVDVLLDTAQAMRRALPGSAGVSDAELTVLAADLAAVRDGRARRPPEPGDALDALPSFTAPPPPPAPPVPPPPPATPALPQPREMPPAASASQPAAPAASLRVDAGRMHGLLDVVGETEVEGRRLERAARDLAAAAADPAGHDVAALLPNLSAVRELAEDHAARLGRLRTEALTLAMVPLRRATAGYAELVALVARRSGRAPGGVRLMVEGEDVELDRRVLDGVSEALGHLVTNAVDHGCDSAEERMRRGKPEQVTVRVAARAAGGIVTITVSDDGGGIDLVRLREAAVRAGHLPADADPPAATLLPLVFRPALSTRSAVSQTSGRGVGLDAVRAVVERLGGGIDVASEAGAGTTFTLTLPVALGVLHCLLCRVGGERYAVPLAAVTETLLVRPAEVARVAGVPVLVREGVPLPLVDLGAALGCPDTAPAEAPKRKVGLVAAGGRALTWLVDGVEGEDELVVTDLGSFLIELQTGRTPLVSGASILGDGRVVCVLDLPALARRDLSAVSPAPAGPAPSAARQTQQQRPTPRVLVVEDSVGVRELERSLLTRAGYDVEVAVDGADGASRLGGRPYDLVVTDLEMPGMDGLALTRMLRSTPGWGAVPVVIVTSRDDERDRRAGLDAGADAYLLKSAFAPADLLGTVSRLLGGPHH